MYKNKWFNYKNKEHFQGTNKTNLRVSNIPKELGRDSPPEFRIALLRLHLFLPYA
jgi:hypothetical protein